MQRVFPIVIATLGLLALSSCSKQSAFDVAQKAVINHDVVALQASLARNGGVVSQGSGFDGSTLLHAALVNTPSFECAELLLKNGADANKPDVTGEYPIHVLCRFNGNEQCLDLLLKHGADPTIRWRGQQTPIELAQEHGYTGAVEILRKAIAKKIGEPDGPANWSQPNRSTTNSRPTPAGSRR